MKRVMKRKLKAPLLALSAALSLGALRALPELPSSSAASPANSSSVLQFHKNDSRDGSYIDPALSRETIRRFKRDDSFKSTIPGPLYAQPLFIEKAAQEKDGLLVATEQNIVQLIDATTGALIWQRKLGEPVPLSALPCGNINPLGVTGTPVADPATRIVYLDAMVSPDGGKTKQHLAFALSWEDGSIRPGWPIDIAAALKARGETFDASAQNQRGALALFGKWLMIPFGGHFGDCGDYHGWVVGIDVTQPSTPPNYYRTAGMKGGIWTPGGISRDGSSLFVSTGNTEGASSWADGDAVIRLTPELDFSRVPADFFAPTNWQDLDATDQDLGSAVPLPVNLSTSSHPSRLIVTMGKNGLAYLLDRDQLGGISEGLSSIQASTSIIITSPALYHTPSGAFVALNSRSARCPSGSGGSLLVLGLTEGSPPSLAPRFCAAQTGQGSPIATSTDGQRDTALWALDVGTENKLKAFSGETGELLFQSDALQGLHRFHLPIVAKGRVYVASDQAITAFQAAP